MDSQAKRQVQTQSVALLDKKFKQPIIFTDSVTVEQVRKTYFPVEVNDFDSMYANLTYLEDMLSIRQRAKMQSFELSAGTTTFLISRHPKAYGDRYDIVFNTKIDEVNSLYTFADGDDSNMEIAERIRDMKKYMMTNKTLFKAPNEIHPKIYNVIVYSD